MMGCVCGGFSSRAKLAHGDALPTPGRWPMCSTWRVSCCPHQHPRIHHLSRPRPPRSPGHSRGCCYARGALLRFGAPAAEHHHSVPGARIDATGREVASLIATKARGSGSYPRVFPPAGTRNPRFPTFFFGRSTWAAALCTISLFLRGRMAKKHCMHCLIFQEMMQNCAVLGAANYPSLFAASASAIRASMSSRVHRAIIIFAWACSMRLATVL